MNQWFLKPSQILIAALVVVCVASWVIIGVPLPSAGLQPRFDWPDETANYFWIHQFTTTGSLVVPEPLNTIANNQIHPRSFNVRDDGSLVPGSFLGMILLFGALARIMGVWIIPLITPILACCAIGAWYGIIRRFFDARLALISSLLLLFHPAWWYYAASPLLPNVPFVSLVLIGLWALIDCREDVWKWGIAGLALGAALAIRPSEFMWVGGVTAAAMVYALTQYKINKILSFTLFLIIAAAMVVPTFFQQQQLYGSALASGYTQLQNSAAACTSCAVIKGAIAPFGVHPGLAISNLAVYVFERLWWWTLPALLGLIVVLTQKRIRQTWLLYIIVAGAISLWLGIYYGSWEFTDQQTVNLNTLGLSYVRYWLPIYIVMTPLVAIAIEWLAQIVPVRLRTFIIGLMLFALLVPSANIALLSRADSLIPVRQRINTYYTIAEQVNTVTEPNAIIITERKDKVFFPERAVIHTFDALSDNADLQNTVDTLITHAPVYYYALAPEHNLQLSHQLELQPIQPFGTEVLYRVSRVLRSQ